MWASELNTRFGMWEAKQYHDLLARCEQQQLMHQRPSKRARKSGSLRTVRGRRALYLAGEGAFKKALGSLTTEMAQMPSTDEHAWARELLPSSERSDALHVRPPDQSGPAEQAE